MYIVGIDLGTTNSLISYWTNNESVLIPNSLGKLLTPSVVGIDENGEVFVGQIAKERMITHPHLTIATFKRYMGTNKEIKLGQYTFLPEDLSSFIIRALKEDAEAYLGESITEAVISVPAYFSDSQRKATKRAGELAGLKVERLINEPTAAAIAYGLHQQAAETTFLVLDLGGGTFDVSIVELYENVIEVKAIAGDNYLGGEDFTELLIQLFAKKHQIALETLDPKVIAAIKKQAELCKFSLSQGATGIMKCYMNGIKLEWSIDLQTFTTAAKNLIDRLRSPIERALKDAALSPEELDSIILVGGATRMQLVHTLVTKLFGRFPTSQINPDEAVAKGAGVQAAMKARNAELKEAVLTDVCPYTLGIEVAIESYDDQYEYGRFSPIIERNTLIPVSRVQHYYTIMDNQDTLQVEIFQGESRLVKNNIKLGKLEIKLRPAPAGEQGIAVRFTYDINGILEVEVTVIESGEKQRIIIENSPGHMSPTEIEQRLALLADIKIHPRERQENKLLLARGERLYEESLGEERCEIGYALQEFENILSSQDPRKIKKATETFKAVLEEIEREEY